MQLLPNRITLKEESNLLSLRNSANPMSIWWSRDLEEGLSLFISWLFGIPYPNHWLSVNRSDLQANHRNSLDVLRAYRGYARMCDGDTVLTLQGTRDKAKVSGWRGQKRGGGGGRAAERTAGNLQENLVAGNVVNKIAEGKQSASCCWEGLPRKRGHAEGGVNLCEISLLLLSSPEFEKQVFSYIMVATKGGWCAPSNSTCVFLQCEEGQICGSAVPLISTQ